MRPRHDHGQSLFCRPHVGSSLTIVAAALSLSICFSFSAGAQSIPERSGGEAGVVYDGAHEITVTGNIEQVVTSNEPDTLAGVHVLVRNSGGLVDAHLGAFLSNDVREALQVGTPVRIVGGNAELHGKQYLLARELCLGGQTIVLRNKRGVPLLKSAIAASVKAQESEGAR